MEIHFFTGKGGVGKSILAATKALRLARSGERVLLVELGDQSYFRFFFDLPEVTYQPASISDWFDVAKWSGKEAFREYARHLIRVESLFKLFFENQVALSLVDAAPGLAELAILGKITSGPPRNVGPKVPYDHLVIDGYSSGHFMALLRAPFGFAEAVSVGPMGEQTRSIIEVLKDPKICRYNVVTQSERMMVEESLELVADIENLIGVKPTVLLNKSLEKPESDFPGGDFGKDMKNFFTDQESARASLGAVAPVAPVPWVLETVPRNVVLELANNVAKGEAP